MALIMRNRYLLAKSCVVFMIVFVFYSYNDQNNLSQTGGTQERASTELNVKEKETLASRNDRENVKQVYKHRSPNEILSNQNHFIDPYMRLTHDVKYEPEYTRIIDQHFPEAWRKQEHCKKNTTVQKFFSVNKDIVGPYGTSAVLLPPDNYCNENTKIIAVIPSHYKNTDFRTQIRKTWVAYEKTNSKVETLKYIFAFGKQATAEMDTAIKKEHETYGDILQYDYTETYKNLTLKLRTAYRWMYENCTQATYVIKIDDDTLAHTPKLLERLSGPVRKRTMIGHCRRREPVQRGHQPGFKYSTTCEEYPFDYFPIYLDGPLFVITMDLIRDLFLMYYHIVPYYLDDAFTTGIMAIPLNVTQECHADFLSHDDSWSIRPGGPDTHITETLESAAAMVPMWNKMIQRDTEITV